MDAVDSELVANLRECQQAEESGHDRTRIDLISPEARVSDAILDDRPAPSSSSACMPLPWTRPFSADPLHNLPPAHIQPEANPASDSELAQIENTRRYGRRAVEPEAEDYEPG